MANRARNSVKSVVSAAIVAFLTVLAHAAVASQQMQNFSPPGGDFSVMMEGSPITKSGLAAGQMCTCYAHDEKEGGYWVTSGSIPNLTNSSQEMINKALNGSATGAVAGIQGTETARYTVNLQRTYPGRQVEGKLPNNQGYFRMRIYLVGPKLYQMFVVGSKAYLERPEPRRFLDSLAMRAPQAVPGAGAGSAPSDSTSRHRTAGLGPQTESDRIKADMAKTREEMAKKSAELHQKVLNSQNEARKNMDHSRARAAGYYQ